jgi:ubiquinone/menaquinone biosynthesis C-methylase UbiE
MKYFKLKTIGLVIICAILLCYNTCLARMIRGEELQDRNVPVVGDILSTSEPSPLAEMILERGLIRPGQQLLSLGAGNGADELLFVDNGLDVLATDNNEVILDHLQQIAENKDNLSIQFLDVTNPFPLDDSSFDVVYARLLLHYFGNTIQQKILDEIYRVLKPGGLVIIQAKSTNDVLYTGEKIDIGDGMFYFPSKDYSRNYISLDELRAMAEQSGFIVLELGEHNETLYSNSYESTLITAILKKPL